ncbi:MAG: hypothetical protein ACK4WH_05490 [Phycisphaerales bacterium]
MSRKSSRSILAAIAVATLSGSCLGQATNLYLIKTENFDLLSRAEIVDPNNPPTLIPNPDNAFWIGHNPSCIAYGKGALFIGGFYSGSAFPLDGADADGDGNTTEFTPFSVSIVKVNNILTTRSFSTIPGSRNSAPSQRGYTGLDYAPNDGLTIRGLVATIDINSGRNLISRYNVDVPGNGVLAAPIPDLTTTFRAGSAGPAWDFGPAGLGVDYAPSGALDGIPDGPVVSVIDFGSRGPYGLDPDTMNPGIGQTLYEFFGNPGVQLNNGPRIVADGEGATLFRDLDIHPTNGDILARANNSVIYNQRNPDGNTTRIDLAPSDPTTTRIGDPGDFLVGQNAQFLHGYGDAGVGEIFVWNSRTSGGTGQPFNSVVRLNKTRRADPAETGQPVTASFLNPDGSPASLPNGNAYYDFFWDEATQVLFVLDFANRNVYLFSNEQPRACCLSDGSCFLLNPSACAAAEVSGAAGAPNSSCSPNPCPQPTIACCFADGTCQSLDDAACATAGGAPQGPGSACSPNPCPQPANGACCTGSICTVTSPGGCFGTFQGSGTSCDPDPCAPQTGACCCGSACSVTTADACVGAGRSFAGVGTACTPYSTTAPCCRGDYNKLGGVTVQDIFDFLNGYFTPDQCADTNDSGTVTVQDIFDFLNAYFAGGC